MKDNQYESPVVKIICDENGIFICKLKDTRVAFDAQETKGIFNFLIKKSLGEPYKIILDTTESFNIPTDGAIEYFLEINESKNRSAVITNTLSMRLFLEQTIRYNKVTNVSFFRKLEKAYKWIIHE